MRDYVCLYVTRTDEGNRLRVSQSLYEPYATRVWDELEHSAEIDAVEKGIEIVLEFFNRHIGELSTHPDSVTSFQQEFARLVGNRPGRLKIWDLQYDIGLIFLPDSCRKQVYAVRWGLYWVQLADIEETAGSHAWVQNDSDHEVVEFYVVDSEDEFHSLATQVHAHIGMSAPIATQRVSDPNPEQFGNMVSARLQEQFDNRNDLSSSLRYLNPIDM